MKKLKVIISGGGTGGHIFPALAIANEIKQRYANADILFVGANGRMEMEKVPQAGYQIKGLNIAGFQRGSLLKNISLPFKVLLSVLAARNIISKFKPDVAVGVGGYASAPLLFAASLSGIPTVIQEQNSFAGVTNKILARWAKRICVAYDGMEKVFPSQKIIKTGNPVRANIAAANYSKEKALDFFGLEKNKAVVLVIGGSLGARTINQSIEATFEKIAENNVQLLWQTGKTYYEDYKHLGNKNPNVKVLQFIDNMDAAYSAADIIISRAGALSISELQIIGKPTILVPSPNVSEDHQTHNAMALVNNNAAIMIKDSEAKFNLIPTAIDLLKYDSATLRNQLATNIRKMAITNAAEKIVNEIISCIKQ
ncbi:MAG TPA: undecaprenyldiphospho-muramoylpentapeptide beta-N-acetylglucosaminyltransferase [Chitinophagales bacterium]|nr:undecaprenyldiphospho-muramoylpentapeptide beta-N-acetylglucosaminyltransferase [Chitinophagales bacterium]HRP39486.1 undecaprenyldiphospho-muramoylpentapeptide beta-N-acetylglucosaminyltransferase [Chitinophagales bacterium]